MADYIDRKAAIAYIHKQAEECQKAFEELGGENGIYADAYNDLAEDFYKIPSVDVVPVVHGHWIEDHGYLKCPECSVMVMWDFAFFDDIGNWNYCPNCGARMDGGVE